MLAATELVNDNGISGVALAFFTAMFGCFATIGVGIIQLKSKAKDAAEAANEAKTEAEQAKQNTVNISNGFAGGVDRKLNHIIDEQLRQRHTTDNIHASIREHLEWHLSKETS